MVAELVETSRLWGRTAARIQPRWVEPLAEHLVRRTYEEPRWDRRRGSVVATERVTLYGLPIVAGAHGRLRADRPRAVARAVHPPRARGGGLGDAARVLRRQPRAAWRRSRRSRSARAGATSSSADQVLFDFFDARIPADVVSGAHFDRWWRDERRAQSRAAAPTPRELLVDPQAAAALDRARGRAPGARASSTLPLSYRFEPGARARRRDRPRAADASCRELRAGRASSGSCPALRARARDGAASARCPRSCAGRSCRCRTSRPQVLERPRAARASRCSTRSARELERAARRARPARRVGPRAACRRTCA